ncbi:MAG: GNAT family N-acetyltransferase [Blastocatellia bacterium]|nr:GNAT family N-acetyltransferase [Blastocatellia bacterium]
METAQISVRRATAADLPFLCRNGELLARQHHAYDPIRFVIFEPPEEAFSRYFSAQLASDEAVFLIAEAGGEPVGYAFLRMEPESFVDLAGPCVWLHDIYVIESARAGGAGAQLIEAAKRTARSMGSPALMLSVAPQNARARGRFEAHGFRVTMQEMRVDFTEE